MVWPSEKNQGCRQNESTPQVLLQLTYTSYFILITRVNFSFFKLSSIPFQDYHPIYSVPPQGNQPKIHLSGPLHRILSKYDSWQQLRTTQTDVAPSRLVQAVQLLTGIQEVPGSTHGRYNKCPHWYRTWFSSVHSGNSKIVSQIRQRLLASTSFPIHYPLIIVPFHVTQSLLPTASLINKLNK